MWGTPMFDLHDAAGMMLEVNACCTECPQECVRVLADRARLRMANRLFAGREQLLDRTALETITAEDIRASRVFQE